MDLKQVLIKQLNFTNLLVEQISQDLTMNHLTIKPEECGNPGIWILGHIAINRAKYIKLCRGDETRVPTRWTYLFGDGSTIEEDYSIYPQPDKIREFMQKELVDAQEYLSAITEAELDSPPVLESDVYTTRTDVFITTIVHEAYHAGQFGLIRKICGLS